MPSASSVQPSCRSPIFFRKQGSLSGTLRTKATAPLFATAIRARPARSPWSSRKTGRAFPNFVPPLKTAYWNHTPMLLVTPQAANRTIGQGGFQEVEQMALFRDMVCYQGEVRDPARIAECLNRVL